MKHAPILSAKAVNAITKDGFHAVGGVIGLCLRVRGNSKQYVLRFTSPVTGRRNVVSLGNFDDLTVAEARTMATNIRNRMLSGIDPVTDKREKKLAAAQSLKPYTFKDAASAWHNMRLETGYFDNRQKTEEIIRRSLELHVYPFIGNILLENLKASDVFNCIRPIWTTTTNMGKFCVGVIGQVWDWAVAMGKVRGDNPARLSTALGVLLRSHGEPKRGRNHGALTPQEIPEFIAELHARPGMASKALLFSILTASRSQPVRRARWADIDLDKKVWIVPEKDMKVKNRGNFTVYLSDQAVELLRSIPRKKEYVFIGDTTGSPIDSTTYVRALEYLVRTRVRNGLPKWIDKRQTKLLGKEVNLTPHGIARASFKTWTRTGENLRRFYTDAVEMCLAHSVDDKYDGAYDRASLEEERRRVMAAWGEYCFSKIVQEPSPSSPQSP